SGITSACQQLSLDGCASRSPDANSPAIAIATIMNEKCVLYFIDLGLSNTCRNRGVQSSARYRAAVTLVALRFPHSTEAHHRTATGIVWLPFSWSSRRW